MPQVTKKDLVDELHKLGHWPKVRTAELLDELGAIVAEALARGEAVTS